MNPTEESDYVFRILRLIEDGLREGDSSRPPPAGVGFVPAFACPVSDAVAAAPESAR